MSLQVINELAKVTMLKAAATGFMRIFEETARKKKSFDVALSGGVTAKEFFSFLVSEIRGHKNLDQIRFFFSDERVVPLESEESNAGNALRNLLDPLSIARRQFFPMYDAKNSSQVCALLYEKLLAKNLAVDKAGLPCFDLLYLGIGLDGHIASLFPNSPLVDAATNHQGYVSVANMPGVLYERITLMPKVINAAKHIHVMAFGAKKAPVIKSILIGPYTPNLFPAQLVLRQTLSQVVLFLGDMGEL